MPLILSAKSFIHYTPYNPQIRCVAADNVQAVHTHHCPSWLDFTEQINRQ